MSDLSGAENSARWLYRYETLLHYLSQAADNEIALLLSENAAILRPVELPVLLAGRDWLLTCAESQQPQTDIQLWRNTEAVRRGLLELVRACRFGAELPAEEAGLLHRFAACPSRHQIAGTHVVVPAAAHLEAVWATWPSFAASVEDKKHHRRFRRALFERVNECNTRGGTLLPGAGSGEPDAAPRTVYNPNKPIALVTLYTPNVACYGRIAEANFRRYCERHGYTLYVHREIPAHLNDGKTSGNWLKPALLREYLPSHQWVFWLDADVLINDMNQRLEPFTQGREFILARDVGSWMFNSGIMGFQRNQRNYDAFADIMDQCAKLEDKSHVYASEGDQFHFIRAFKDLQASQVSNFIDINTPWVYRRPDSFMVHYIGMWQDNRALLMEHDLRHAAME
ncbi:hypothetical protein [Caballeronia hypogeia]|nr:hypothetical protein [Caballeronia hypogeia]